MIHWPTMRIERFDPAGDKASLRACYEVESAATAVDDPAGPGDSLRSFGQWLANGWSGAPVETWLAPGAAPASADGWYMIQLSAKDNQDLAFLALYVHPDRRREGLGTGLLRHAAERARADGRSLLTAFAWQDSPGAAFARARGGVPSSVIEIRRVLHVGAAAVKRLESLRAEARRMSAGYSIVSWQLPTPEEHLEQVAKIRAALDDAPHPESWEPIRWDANRVRDLDRRSQEQEMRRYSVAARHDATGELVGLTEIDLDPSRPEWGFQGLTAVLPPHRGHRLGLLLKVAMQDLLAQAEPGLLHIVTGNADANSPMVAINEALGYQILGKPARSWEFRLA